jgi:UDP-N-acetyl-alpha-D-quinovosamine dehydrogenase
MPANAPANVSTALITGSNGFIGRTLCKTLAHNGWCVVGVSRRLDYGSGIPGVRDVCLSLNAAPDQWRQAMVSTSCVVHLAARVHQLEKTKGRHDVAYKVNVEGSRFVAEQAALAGVRRFVFLSSIKVHGEGEVGRPYTADDTPNPSDDYGQSKLDAERALADICRNAGMELIVVRPPLVYGPGVRANFERLMKLAALGLPLPLRAINNRRSLISVWNLASFIETTMRHPASQRIWLVSDGEDLSTPDLFSRLARLMGIEPKLFRLSPVWLKRLAAMVGLGAEANRLCDSLQVDMSPAQIRLNWTPPISVNEGLARTVEWYNAAHKN